MPRLVSPGSIVGLALGALLAAAPAGAQTDLPGTTDNMPTEVTLPEGDTQPAITFRNTTGVRICDLVITRRVGAFNITGALLDDPRHGSNEDWDVDDDRMNGLDGGENGTAPAAEGAGAAALAHADNTQAGATTIRIEEDGNNDCVHPNRNFEVTLTLSAAPAKGDKIAIQPTNNVRANIYALKPEEDAQDCSQTSWTLDPALQVNTLFATHGPPFTRQYLGLTLQPLGVSIIDLFVDVPASVDPLAGTVIFDRPEATFNLGGELDTFGTLIVTPQCTTIESVPTLDGWGRLVLALALLAAALLLMRARRGGAAPAAGAAALILALAAPAHAQTELPGTTDNMPVELEMPIGDAQPALTFTNKTGVPICDLVITRTVGPWSITGALVNDDNQAGEDYDVDDNQMNGITDGGESSAAPGGGGEGVGAAALTHADNTQPAGASIRVEENGNNQCVGDNRSFQVTLTLTAAPTQAGDKITVQPTNGRGANIYDLVEEDGSCSETSWTLDPATQINTLFASHGSQTGRLYEGVVLTPVEGGLQIVDLFTSVPATVNLAAGSVVFDAPVLSFDLDGELSGFGTVSVSPECGPLPVPALSGWSLALLALALLPVLVLARFAAAPRASA